LLVETRSGFEASCAIIDQRAGGQLDPEVAHAFLRLAPQLVEEIASADPWQAVLDSEPPPHHTVTGSRLDDLARAFGDVVDLKTRFTPGHTSGVAHLAEEAARQLRFAEAEVTAVRRAGLLHDLGRAGVANGIWERAGSLTHADWELVRLHAYHSERILDRSPSLELLAPIVGMHHERQDGSGYHRQARSTTIPMTARLLAAADVYDALTHDRPHRRAMASEMAAEQLRAEARSGRLDDDAVRGVLTAAGHSAPEMRRVWPCGLSDREVEVLRLLARGLSTREIAQQLVIAPKTADHHIQHIYTKIGVSTRAAATLFVLEHDLHRT
jgi:putative nucleotidyltransferase with HDIG domain